MTARVPTPRRTERAGATTSDLPEVDRLSLTGKFAEQVTVIPKSQSSLILAMGRRAADGADSGSVLLPFIEIMFAGIRQGDNADGDEDPALEDIFAHTLPLENALWLTYDVVRDIRIACGRLNQMVPGPIAFDHARMIHARFFAEQLRAQADLCVTLIDELATRAVRGSE